MDKKMKVFESLISFKGNLHLLWYFELRLSN